MNRLKRQEDENAITLASAFREGYHRAKRQKNILWIITFILSALSLSIENYNTLPLDEIKPTTISSALILVSIINIFYSSIGNSSLIKNRHIKASQIQRKWDNYVFQIAHAPGPEVVKKSEINRLSEKWLKRKPKDFHNIKHWFSKNSYSIPDNFSVLAALYSSASWETELRKKYEIILSIALCAIIFGTTVFSISQNYTLEKYILMMLVPVAPALLLIIDELCNNHKNKKDSETLQFSMTECIRSNRYRDPDFAADSFVYDWHLYRQNCTEIPHILFAATQKAMNKDMYFDFEDINEILD